MSFRIKLLIILGAFLCSPIFTLAQALLWENSINLPDDQYSTSIAEADSGYLIYGTGRYIAQGMQETAEIIKVDFSGNLMWKKRVLRPNVNISYSGDIVKIQNENNYYVTGTYIQGSTFDFLYKITGQGDTLWRNTYQYFGFFNTVRSPLILNDNSVVVTGWNQYPNTMADVIVRRIDSLGHLMWEKNYPMPGDQEGHDIVEMMDGSLIVAGEDYRDDNILLLRIGFDGVILDSIRAPSIGGNPVFQDANLHPENNIGIGLLNRQNFTINTGQYLSLDTNLIVTGSLQQQNGIYFGPVVLNNSSYIFNRLTSNNSFAITINDQTTLSEIWNLTYGNASSNFKIAYDYWIDNDDLILSGYHDTLNSTNYWVAKIDSVGEEWIPDRCSYQPPVAGFDFEYNYPVLTLRDTSSGGLKYLDTVYTWQWNTSVGTSGTDDSLLVFFDTAISNTIDVELIISNWYGCRDTVNKTLIFEPNGISEYRDLEVKIYPNPVSDYLNIEFSETPDREVLLELYDVQGIKRGKNLFNERTTNFVLRTSELPSGLYFYSLSTDEQIIRGKIVKQ